MKIAVTGAKGVVGRAIISQLDPAKFKITPIDLPEHDASSLKELIELTKNHDAIIHCAWNALKDNYQSGMIDPMNNEMTFNVYKAAEVNQVPRVIMSSSNHAHNHGLRDADGKIRPSIAPVPDSPYGAEKVFMEALGRYFAHDYGIKVVCIRIGNVNKDNTPNTDTPPRWLSYQDLGRLITKCLEADEIPNNFQIVYGVSRQNVFDWTNTLGYEPADTA